MWPRPRQSADRQVVAKHKRSQIICWKIYQKIKLRSSQQNASEKKRNRNSIIHILYIWFTYFSWARYKTYAMTHMITICQCVESFLMVCIKENIMRHPFRNTWRISFILKFWKVVKKYDEQWKIDYVCNHIQDKFHCIDLLW